MIKMKAVICSKYGSPEVLKLVKTTKPIPKDDEVLVKIHTTAVTASDCVIRGLNIPGKPSYLKEVIMKFFMRLFIGYSKPRNPVLGLVFSGIVESVGRKIKNFKEGDAIYGFTGNSRGTYAEYKCVSMQEIIKGEVAKKASNISHEEATAIIYGATLAMFFMGDDQHYAGKKVFIYGASGAIGTIAVQLAKYFGAEVTGVCGSSNLELVESLGATKVLDYTEERIVDDLDSYDFIFDAVGRNKTSKLKKKLKESFSKQGKYVSVDDRLLKITPNYLLRLNDLIEQGHIRAIIDRYYPLERIVEAHQYVETGHKKGNVIIRVE